jgi:hypothetical protein
MNEIHRRRLLGDRYAAKMTCVPNYAHINFWTKNFHPIPQQVERV